MRLEFTTPTMRAAFDRSGGFCECARLAHLKIPGVQPGGCGVELNQRNGIYYEHINQAFVRDDNGLENCAVLVRTCWRIKTDFCDLPTVARVKQRMDTNRGISRKPKSKLSKAYRREQLRWRQEQEAKHEHE